MRPVSALVLFKLIVVISALQIADAGESYIHWQVDDLAIHKPLGGLKGDPIRGREIARDTEAGNCLACHQLPIPEESFHGTVGPDLTNIASRLTEAEIRLRVVDEKVINPVTIMPGYYRHPDKFNQVSKEYAGKTFLTAQQVEDVVAYLVTLK